MAASGRLTRPVLVILGATGAGKSKLAVEMATLFNGEIISADSMQLYKGLDIVTNKPTEEELALCRHHLIDFVSPLQRNYTVTEYSDAALPIMDRLLDKAKMPVIVGGTNYYIESLLWKFLLPSRKSADNLAPLASNDNRTHSVEPSGECRGKHNATVSPPSEYYMNNMSQLDDQNQGKYRGKRADESRQAGNKEDREMSCDKGSTEVKSAQYKRLWEVDPETASRIHPSNVRKVARALQVFDQQGVSMSQLLADQHGEEGAGAVSGPLRYPNPCVIWVQCQQEVVWAVGRQKPYSVCRALLALIYQKLIVLDERTDRRVDEMMDRGLIDELIQFHHLYNQQRLGADNVFREADYTLGIFQTIGFKEFHDYLLLSPKDRQTDAGRKLQQEGVDKMKHATRRYARRQTKWIKNRFLKRRGSNMPLVYAVDASSAALWQENVHNPAKAIISAYLQGEVSPVDPMRLEENSNVPEYNVCEPCGGRVFTCLADWQAHLRGRSHRSVMKKRNREKKQQQQILVMQLDARIAQLQLQQGSVAAEVSEGSDVT